MISFAYRYVLLALLLLLPLFYYLWHYRPMPSFRISSVKAFQAAGGRRRHPAGWPFWCSLFGAVLLIVALARPRIGDEKVVIKAEGIDIVLALDLSGSMQVFDVPTNITTTEQLVRAINNGSVKNRLEVAKEELGKFIDKRVNDRIGLIGFAEQPYNIAPPTLDHAWLLANLKRLEPGAIGNRTGIAGPIASGTKRLEDSDAPRRVLVLFTDGSNNVDNRITPRQAAELAHNSNVIIYTVGIGSNNAYAMQELFGQMRFEPAPDQFDEELLQDIAKISNGKYFHAADAKGFEEAMNEISQLEKTSFEQPKYVEYKEFAPTLALIGGLLILLGFLAEHTWKLRIP
ncbi:VWA domain-containing protein [Victivallis sp. Marseille-Q1083]|uniref:VWA domain-containing protein n=1 Tax=Victivallis sp. Marseille-Q1083 TaxID=2717288 RepID=UPI0015894B47|nr:VWA domain-containing protein [Victivallis sp. Marseille-Q1083]